MFYRYVTATVTCSNFDRSEARGDIIGVSLTNDSCQEPRNIISVKQRSPNWKPTHQFSMCPGVMFGNYSDLDDFVQYVEVNNIFGGDFVTLYNYSISPTLEPYIDYYKLKKRLEVVQWNLPVKSNENALSDENNDVHYFAQTAAMSDCLYRAYLSSKFVVYLDLDELIVPINGSKKWLDFMPEHRKFGAYQIRSTFFPRECKRFENHLTNPLLQRLPLKAFQYFFRQEYIFPYRVRSKWIGRPENVEIAEIHFPGALRNAKEYLVPETHALVYHYRYWKGCKDKTIINEQILGLKEDTLTRLYNLTHAIVT